MRALLTAEQFFTQPQSPQEVRSGAFTYQSDGQLLLDGHARASWSELESKADSAEISWVVAQLTLWGIHCRDKDYHPGLRAKLRRSVNRIKTTGASPQMKAVEESLKKDFAKQMEEFENAHLEWRKKFFLRQKAPDDEARWDPELFVAKYFLTEYHGVPDKTKQKAPLVLSIQDYGDMELTKSVRAVPGLAIRSPKSYTLIGWEEAIPEAMQNLFATLSSQRYRSAGDLPTAEVEFDIDLFMSKYFLKKNGQPDPRKIKNPLRVQNTLWTPGCFEKTIKSVPGLHIRYVSSREVSKSYFFIGWDLNKVNKRVCAMEAEFAKEEAEKRAREEAWSREWDERMKEMKKKAEERAKALFKPHKDFMAAFSPPPGALTLNDLTGSYLVQSHDLPFELRVDGWDALELHIQPPKSPHGVVACMDFGFVKGMMLLALSEQSLRDFSDEMKIDPETRNQAEGAEAEAPVPAPGGRKRKRSGVEKPKGRKPSVNRVFGIGWQERRVFFRWVGADPQDRVIEIGVDDVLNCGYLDFRSSKAAARGKMAYIPPILDKHKFALSLYKVSSEPKEEPLKKWSDYASRKYPMLQALE
ncbi:hypothetical protein BJX63DRAFT_1625 [Aspergillus granulosus]|uniref:Uncharacterized protein n=1 Tax=Aspergillus granulosus TaxID=176169 RepID=A0ABR4I5L2_9EURO